MEEDLTKYLYKKMLSEAKNYQWRVVLDSHKQALEIYFIVSLETNEKQDVQDVNGQVNRSKQLLFEQVACFYNHKNHRIVPNNYLYAVPFDPDLGIDEGEVDAYLKQQHIHIASARGQLREFLLDDNQKEFTMQWNDIYVRDTIETMRQTNRYSTNKLTFTNQEEKSIVDQFKEEQYDGLERI